MKTITTSDASICSIPKVLARILLITFTIALHAAAAPVGICLHCYSPVAPPDKIECFEYERFEQTKESTRYFLSNGQSAVLPANRIRGVVLYPGMQTTSAKDWADVLKTYEAHAKQSPATRPYLNPWILKIRASEAAITKQVDVVSKLPSITLSDGTVLKGCKALKKDTSMVSLMHADGVTKIKISELSDATKKELDLDSIPMSVAPAPEGVAAEGIKPPSEAPPAADRKESIAIKGLYIGMAGANAIKTIVKQGKGRISVRPTANAARTGYDILLLESNKQRSFPSGSISTNQTDGTVSGFSFDSDLCNYLFNSGALSAEEFAQTFIDSYDIPTLTPHDTWGRGGVSWRYVSPDGWTLYIASIRHAKRVSMGKTPELKFD